MTGIEAVLARTRASGSTAPQVPGSGGADELRQVAQEFEALFIKQMLDTMRSTIDRSDSLLHGGKAEEIFEDMLFEEYSVLMSRTRSFGLSDMIYEQLSESTGPTAADLSRARAYDQQIPSID
ncbi:MAG: hypothetical protein EA383_03335 [Spirochaetaceae bacterium]|nr:MAG: hypothetical protein EA383_03335 [Spirochaetaceae bacterium]